MNRKRKNLLAVVIPLVMFLISLGIAKEVSYGNPFDADTIPVWIICITAVSVFTYFFTFKDARDE